jgi:signal transduction histidine kinase/HAMP domain-containing protein
MPIRLLSSLSFQVSGAFVLLLLLFSAASLYSLGSFQRQLAYDSVVDIAGRLELTAQRLHTQAMNYEQNAPRDYKTYYRDVRLYYQDLMSHVDTFDQVIEDFMHGDFRGEMEGLLPWLRPNVSSSVTQAIHHMEQTWSAYRAGLFSALGPEVGEPRLEYAAEHNLANHAALEEAAKALTQSLREWATAEHRKVMRVSLLLVIVAGSLVAILILVILHIKTLAPLKRTIAGIHRVADGDFDHRIPVGGSFEVRQLTDSVNALSGRLDVLFKLIERLQLGNDLDEVIGFLSQEFPGLLRIDWIGVVLVSGDGTTARLEVSYLDGNPERLTKQLFALKGTLLEQALDGGEPLHITNMAKTAAGNSHYQFLRSLADRGMRDTIFLPLTPKTLTPIPAVVVFATRTPGCYDEAHLHFLDNIAQLITHSFGRTVRLAEHGRLAAIGEFASGIAHELRTPLSTLALAVDYFDRLELDEKAAKRIRLARQESARMQRLLAEMLLYAKPVDLQLQSLPVAQVLAQFLEDHRDLAEPGNQDLILIGSDTDARIMADRDRLMQVLINLTQNACEAAPRCTKIVWTVQDEPGTGGVTLQVQNFGDPIPAELIGRITEPFFSTKPSGSGLGLAIVRRLTLVQGGQLSVESDEIDGTRVRISFPRCAPEGRSGS